MFVSLDLIRYTCWVKLENILDWLSHKTSRCVYNHVLSLCVLCHVIDHYATNIKLGEGGGGVTCMYQTCLFHLVGIAAVIMWTQINKADCQIEIWMIILVDWEFMSMIVMEEPKFNGINYFWI